MEILKRVKKDEDITTALTQYEAWLKENKSQVRFKNMSSIKIPLGSVTFQCTRSPGHEVGFRMHIS